MAYIMSNDRDMPAISFTNISPCFCGSGTYIVTLSADTVDDDSENDINTMNKHMMINFKNIFYTGCTINIMFCANTIAASLMQFIASLINWKLRITNSVYATAPICTAHLPMLKACNGIKSWLHNGAPDAS